MVGSAAYAQDPPPQQDPQDQTGGGRGGRAADPVIRPYDRVITKDAQSKTGVFTRAPHQGPSLLRDSEGRSSDASSSGSARSRARRSAPARAARPRATASSAGSGAAIACSCAASPTRSPRMPKTPIARAVRDANYDPIVMSFNIEALGKDDAPVIEVTRLFTSDVPEFSGRTRVRARTFDAVALVRRSRGGVPREHRGRVDPDLQQPARRRRRPRRRAGAGARRRTRRRARASRQRHRGDALQHGAAARKADAAAAVRRARRLLLRPARSTTARTSTRRPSAAFITR